MPFSVIVCYKACCLGVCVRLDSLVEDDGEPSVGPHAELPRTAAATLDSAVIRGWIRRPPEPGGDREFRGRDRNLWSCDPIPASVEVPRQSDFPRDDRRARYGPIVSMSREILLKSGAREGLHVVGQEGIADCEGEPRGACNRAIRGLDVHDIRTGWSAR